MSTHQSGKQYFKRKWEQFPLINMCLIEGAWPSLRKKWPIQLQKTIYY